MNHARTCRPSIRFALLATCLCASVLGASCDRASPVVGNNDLSLDDISPRSGELHVPLNMALKLRFNQYLLPASVLRQSLIVTSGTLDPETQTPKGPSYYLEPIYDPYERIVIYRPYRSRTWTPTTWHTVRVIAASEPSDPVGFRSITGATLAQSDNASFMTSNHDTGHSCNLPKGHQLYCGIDAAATPSPTDRTADRWPRLPAVWSVLQTSCATSGCHQSDHPLGLDLSSPQAIRTTAIGVVARQTMHGPTMPAAPAAFPTRFGTDMPRISPFSPANSYLVNKLLVHPGNHPPATPSSATDTNDKADPDCWVEPLAPVAPPSESQLDQLRNHVVHGLPMPPNGQLTPPQMRAIVRWIIAGAQIPDACPATSD